MVASPAVTKSGSAIQPDRSIAVSCSRLTRHFGGLKALQNVTFGIAGGEILGILGPNGAGKTTFINVLSGLLPATSGTVRIYGDDVTNMDMSGRARMGLLRTFQNTRPSDVLTGAEMLRLAALSPNGSTGGVAYTADEILEIFSLTAYADTILSDLPYGVQKMINLAAVAVCRPRVLLLDEPFQGVADPEIVKLSKVIRHFADSGVAVGLVEHNVRSVMRLCNRVMVLDSGTLIFEGAGEDAVRDPGVQEAYLGQRFASELNA